MPRSGVGAAHTTDCLPALAQHAASKPGEKGELCALTAKEIPANNPVADKLREWCGSPAR